MEAYPQAVWLNLVPQKYWGETVSIGMIRRLTEDRMFLLTLDGLDPRDAPPQAPRLTPATIGASNQIRSPSP